MCNLYALGRQGPDTLRAYYGADRDEIGNMPELPGIYPKTLAPVVLMQGQDRVLTIVVGHAIPRLRAQRQEGGPQRHQRAAHDLTTLEAMARRGAPMPRAAD